MPKVAKRNCESVKATKKGRGPGKSKTDPGVDKSRKIWTTEEVNQMAEFVIHYGGKIVPRAAFIRAMRATLGWNELTEGQIGNRWDVLHNAYKETNKWRNETGQGVKEQDGESAFHAALLKRCPQFDVLDSVLGTRVSVNAPATVESAGPEDPDSSNHNDVGEHIVLDELLFQDDLEELDQEPVTTTPHEKVFEAATAFRASLTRTSDKFKDFPKSGQDRIAMAYEKKALIEDKKLQLLREEFDFQKKLQMDKLKLESYEKEQKCKNEQLQAILKYKVEVAKLTQDPELLKSLVQNCLEAENSVPSPPLFPDQ